MRTSTFRRCLFYRSLLGCGFLFLGGAGPVWAQREVEVQLSGGVSLTQPAIRRNNLPRAFRTPGGFNTAATLRLTLPLTNKLGLGIEQRATGLSQGFMYRVANSRRSTGILTGTVHQSGLSLRLYDIWQPGPRWGLDVALTGSYGWASRGSWQEESILFFDAASQPTDNNPVVRVNTINRKGTPMIGAETVLRYEWGLRNTLLLTATYQRGLRQLGEVRSTQVDYLDAAGAVQQGSFVVSSYGSYGSVQLGYGLRLGAIATARNKHPTPRYSLDDAEDANDDSPIN
ncbi:hypothetical protein J0X19_15595 [Hymenobacter sp. BT186]|uniref:Uncharacterized protein n=1 Tax=Hymenobacter telluris TaxID=2816474 RepID=A0A939EY99_9BACT|nr:hypothetical protein [Hymenobacter telluris]MBO0359387.1 hypothetical protein [Hymenobacter telluris]MBW3375413.1 hypothetical protein [Hymenobacter norwichensis]